MIAEITHPNSMYLVCLLYQIEGLAGKCYDLSSLQAKGLQHAQILLNALFFLPLPMALGKTKRKLTIQIKMSLKNWKGFRCTLKIKESVFSLFIEWE